MNQLVNRLRLELASAEAPDRRAELFAKIVCNLARVGKLDEARQGIEELRRDYGAGQSGRVTVWIMLAEGLIHLYGELSPLALDRISRAQALGMALRYSSIVAIASAWKAHIEFESSKFDSMLASLRLALEHVEPTNHDARIRISMVLSNSFMLCGSKSEAQKWFLIGRDQAIKSGDQASIEGLLYNRAAFGFALARARNCLFRVDREELAVIKSEIQSARNLQELTGISALTEHVHLWAARLLLVEGRYEDAIESLRAVRDKGPFAINNFSQSFIDLEIAYCLAKLGRMLEANSLFDTINFDFVDSLDVDEKLVVSWLLLEMTGLSGGFGKAEDRKETFNLICQDYSSSISRLSSGLREFEIA